MSCKSVSVFVAALCCILKILPLVEGRYLVEVELHGYHNPTGRCRGCLFDGRRGCCDRFNTINCDGDLQCDSYFVYCLAINQGCAPSSQRMTSTSNENDGPLNFSSSLVLGLENPFILEGLEDAYEEVRLRVSVRDRDDPDNDDELVDILLIDHDLPVGETSPRRNHTGIYNFNYVMMDLSITVHCAPNFQGPDCTQCVSGYTGDDCTENINECAGIDCNGRGVCEDGIDMFLCDCEPGFTGIQCETNIDDCAGVNCSTRGQCMDRVNSFSCLCDAGFTGELCGDNIDDCKVDSCSGHGQCIDGVNTFSCVCEEGFTGEVCETDINECNSFGVTCSGHGECIDHVNGFSCLCNKDYIGPRCEVNVSDCKNAICNGNGECMDGAASLACVCDPGYTGESCKIDIDDCAGVNCSGNGKCIDGVDSFICECQSGHSGPLCAEQLSGNRSLGPIVGGVLGIILSLLIVFIIVVALVLVIRCRNMQGKTALGGGAKTSRSQREGALPGDNPIYDGGDSTISLAGIPWNALTAHYENLPSSEPRGRSFSNREFDNPIYGRNGTGTGESLYAYPDDPQLGVGQSVLPYHEFDNPIYGREGVENTYSEVHEPAVANGVATTTTTESIRTCSDHDYDHPC